MSEESGKPRTSGLGAVTPQPYTPATIAFIREEAEKGRSADSCASLVGWTRSELDRRCAPYGIIFAPRIGAITEAKADVTTGAHYGRPRGPLPARSAYITVALTPEIRERLRNDAALKHVSIARHVGDLITKAVGEAEGKS